MVAEPVPGTQWQWASSLSNPPAFFTNTGNPGPISAYWNRSGPRACFDPNSYSDTGCAYNYGWNASADALSVASNATSASAARSHNWWLDVEVANSWNGTYDANRAALQGFIDYFHQAGVPQLGVYSTWFQWGQITGNWVLSDMPNWVAGPGSAASAPSYCDTSATGGPVQLVQYPYNGFSADMTCGGGSVEPTATATPVPPTATSTPTKTPVATMTPTAVTPTQTATSLPSSTPTGTSTAVPSATPTVPAQTSSVSDDGFESGNWSGGSGWTGAWATSGSPRVYRFSGPESGVYHAQLRRRDSITRVANTSGLQTVNLSFGVKASSWESGDGAQIQVSTDGQTWSTLLSMGNGDDDNQYHDYSFDVSGYAAGGALWMRFVSTSSATSDYLYVDNVRIEASGGTASQSPTATPSFTPTASATATFTPVPSATVTQTSTPTQTATATPTATSTATVSPTATATATAVPSATSTPTATSTPNSGATPVPWWCRYVPSLCP